MSQQNKISKKTRAFETVRAAKWKERRYVAINQSYKVHDVKYTHKSNCKNTSNKSQKHA